MEKEIELEQEAIVVYSGGGAVSSVNGYTGDVVLTTSDLENTSDYQTGAEVESAISTAIAGKQDTLTAGNNITISNNTISATDTTYSAGTGLTLNGTQFSVNTETIATQQDVSNEATARENADINLQGQIDAISSASDVTDIVGTYAALQAYDTTHLKDNDIIKVLQDESQDDETTYYRWSTSTQSFTLIGEEGPYYTKSQTDTLLQAKQDTLTAGSNITIASDNTISATDTTYSAFTGTDGQTAGTSGLVPAPATTDAGKFLKADGTWDTAGGGGGPTVVQTTGTSQTDVMSQNATTEMIYTPKQTSQYDNWGAVYIGNKDSNNNVYADPASSGTKTYFYGLPHQASSEPVTPQNRCVCIMGSSSGVEGVSIGMASTTAIGGVVIGNSAHGYSNYSVAIGHTAEVSGANYGVALGAYSKPTRSGEVNIGTGTQNYGYNNTPYRVLGGVHDPVDNHDAATKGYVDTNAGGVKTLTSADYNFPSNSPSVIAPWLLPVGQYVVAPNTDVMPDGNSSTYHLSERIGLVVITQATNVGNNYGAFIFSSNLVNKYYKVQYNGTPVTGFPHEI